MTVSLASVYSLLATMWIASLWQGLALALMAAALLRLTPRASAALRHTLLLGIFTAATVLPLFHFGGRAAALASQPAAAPIRLAPWFAACVALAWLAASAARAMSLIVAWMHLRKVRQNAKPVAIQGLPNFSSGRRRAVLCTSADVSTPAVLGFFRPVLLLPEWLPSMLSQEGLREIALHECEHLRRRDDWVNLLLQIGLVVMPLNPALLWLNRRIGVQRELACDAAVIASAAKPIAYAASLTRLAEQRLQRNSLRLALAALGQRSELAQRVHTLLREPVEGWSRRQSAAAVTVAALALLTASAGLTRIPGMVRVADAPDEQSTVAVVTPAAAAGMLRENAIPGLKADPVRLMPASFELKPPIRPRHKTAHRTVKMKHQTVDAAETQQRPALRTARLVRTASTGPMHTVEAAVQQDGGAARVVTTEFLQPYVAVPVHGGWLLIEL